MLSYFRCEQCGLTSQSGDRTLRDTQGNHVGHAYLTCSGCGTCHVVPLTGDMAFQICGQPGPAITESERGLLHCFSAQWDGEETVRDLNDALASGQCCHCHQTGTLVTLQDDSACPQCDASPLKRVSSFMT